MMGGKGRAADWLLLAGRDSHLSANETLHVGKLTHIIAVDASLSAPRPLRGLPAWKCVPAARNNTTFAGGIKEVQPQVFLVKCGNVHRVRAKTFSPLEESFFDFFRWAEL